jgi:hypothetical protein
MVFLAAIQLRFKGSTLEILGASTIEEEEGEWAIVGGTGDLAMARGIVQRKTAEKRPDGETVELTIDVFCRMKVSIYPIRSCPTVVQYSSLDLEHLPICFDDC